MWCAQDALYGIIINNQWANVAARDFQDSAGVVTVRYERGPPTNEKVSKVASNNN